MLSSYKAILLRWCRHRYERQQLWLLRHVPSNAMILEKSSRSITTTCLTVLCRRWRSLRRLMRPFWSNATIRINTFKPLFLWCRFVLLFLTEFQEDYIRLRFKQQNKREVNEVGSNREKNTFERERKHPWCKSRILSAENITKRSWTAITNAILVWRGVRSLKAFRHRSLSEHELQEQRRQE